MDEKDTVDVEPEVKPEVKEKKKSKKSSEAAARKESVPEVPEVQHKPRKDSLEKPRKESVSEVPTSRKSSVAKSERGSVKERQAGRVIAMDELDITKVAEMLEAFEIFDLNKDGYICGEDLKATFLTMGQDIGDAYIQKMMFDAGNSPLDFDAFAALLGNQGLNLEPEGVLLDCLSWWDQENTGLIEEERLLRDLTTFGDPLTMEEAMSALAEAPIIKKQEASFLVDPISFVDYPAFCKKIGGFRKCENNAGRFLDENK